MLRIKSFNELNMMIKNHEFSKLVPRGTKLPQVDAIVRAKNNNINSLRLARKTVNKTKAVDVWEDEKGFEKVEI